MRTPAVFRSRSLRQQFAITIALVSVVSVLLAAGMLTARATAHRRDARRLYLAESADAVCRATDAYLDKYVASIRTLADATPPSALLGAGATRSSRPVIGASLARFHSARAGFLTVLAARGDGVIVAAHGHGIRPDIAVSGASSNVSDRDYFRTAIRTGTPFISDAFRGRGFGADAIVAISAPIRDSAGVATGIVEGSLDLRAFGAEAGPFTSNRNLAFLIVDRAARVVHATEGARFPLLTRPLGDPLFVALGAVGGVAMPPVQQPSPSMVVELPINGHVTWGAACITRYGWRVIARLEPSALQRDQRELLALGGVVALVACMASMLIAGWTASRIAKPLTAVTTAVGIGARVAGDPNHVGYPPSTRRTSARTVLGTTHPDAAWEIVALAEHLDERLARAERAEREMQHELTRREHVIAQRTQELSDTNRSLADSERELRALFAAMNDVVLVLDAQGTFLRVIPTAPDLLYRPRDEVIGKRLHEIFPVEQADRFLATVQRVIETQQAQSLDYTLELAHGLTWFESTASPLADGTVLWVARDTTAVAVARTALEESERQHRMLIETAPDIIYRTDTDGRIVFVNAAASAILGLPNADILGAHFSALVQPDAVQVLTAFYQDQIRERVEVTYREVPCISRDGREVWVGQHVRLMVERERVVGMHAVARDITAQHAIERAKDDFVSLVSHELRTPLTSIKGSLALLASGRIETLSPTAQRLLAMASQNADRLVRMVNGILDLQRLDSQPASATICREALAPVLHEAANAVRGIADAELVTVHVDDCTGDAWIDRDRMVQVLVNLLGNAIKFSHPGGIVTLSAVREHGHWHIDVRDHGCGIPVGELERIFERFHQVDASDARAHAGSGLGLSICRQIVAQHAGHITATSELQHGSVFTVTLPCDSLHAETAHPSPSMAGASA